MTDSDSTTPDTPVWELFLDDHVITRSTGFRRVLHHPAPRGIVIPADRPWDQGGLSVIYVGGRADGTFECYYQVRGLSDEEMSSGEFIAYAVSQDGIRWEKPILNLVNSPLGTETNLVPCGPPVDLGLHGNVSDPARRFAIALGDDSRHCLRLYFGNELPMCLATTLPRAAWYCGSISAIWSSHCSTCSDASCLLPAGFCLCAAKCAIRSAWFSARNVSSLSW